MAKTTQNVYGRYSKYTDCIKEQQPSSFSMRIFSSLGVVLVLTLFSTMFVAAAEQADTYSFYLVSYPASDQATIANAQQQLQEYFGSRLEGYVDSHQYLVYATIAELQTLQENDLITSFIQYIPQYIPTASESLLGDTTGTEDVIITVFANADEQHIAEQLKNLGINVAVVSDTVIAGSLVRDSMNDVLALKGIIHIEEKPQYKLFNDKSVIMSGVADVRQRFQLYGKNQIISILDGGLDTGKIDASMHDDIEGRIVGITDVWDTTFCCSDNGTDYDSHGTHVTGIALGNGVLSGSNPSQQQYINSYAGVAPEAKVDFYSMGGNKGTNTMPPLVLSQSVFTPSYQKGSRVNTNSWGIIGANAKYNSDAKDIDNFMWQNKDYLVIFAAGNEVGPATVTPPSTAKNGISVSGILRDNANTHVYAEGPTMDGRIKPDVVAPAVASLGVGIMSTRSSMQTPQQTGCRNLNNYYCDQAGTSMAAPHVAGSAALLREFYITRQNLLNPTAALIKATLLNGGQPVNGNSIPGFQNGFGRLNLTDSLPSYPGFLGYADERSGISTSQKKTYTYSVDVAYPFSLTLAWTDRAPTTYSNQSQKKLINDLDLVVTDPQGNQYFGNDITAPYNNQPDRLNNVEQVRIATPVKGKYTVEVKGTNIPQGPQDFAFALTYDNALINVIPKRYIVAPCIIGGQPC